MEQEYDILPIVGRYLLLGLGIGKHIPGFVDAYYGPAGLAEKAVELNLSPPLLLEEARSLLVDIDRGEPLGNALPGGHGQVGIVADLASAETSSKRRSFLRAQTVGLLTTCRKLCGEDIAYKEEVELSYQVTPSKISQDEILYAHEQLDSILPGKTNLKDRFIAWREKQVVPGDKLLELVNRLSEDFRLRTKNIFSLPDGESVEWIFESNKPWSGFNYYLGNLKSKVAINVDLPVPIGSVAHLVAHESYPGHHSEHSKKEAGLVRKYKFLEESLFLVGTPQCLISEGLADLGLEILLGEEAEVNLKDHFVALGIPYDPEEHERVRRAASVLSKVRSNAALMLHDEHLDSDFVTTEIERLALLPNSRAKKTIDFLSDPLWRTYIFCYEEGLPLCRKYTGGDHRKFLELLSEQMLPSELQ